MIAARLLIIDRVWILAPIKYPWKEGAIYEITKSSVLYYALKYKIIILPDIAQFCSYHFVSSFIFSAMKHVPAVISKKATDRSSKSNVNKVVYYR